MTSPSMPQTTLQPKMLPAVTPQPTQPSKTSSVKSAHRPGNAFTPFINQETYKPSLKKPLEKDTCTFSICPDQIRRNAVAEQRELEMDQLLKELGHQDHNIFGNPFASPGEGGH